MLETASGLGETLGNAQMLEVGEGLSQKESLMESSMMELGRYFNSKDEPIVLAKTNNHARLVLQRRSRNLAKTKNLEVEEDAQD